jgi:hypothetical protein
LRILLSLNRIGHATAVARSSYSPRSLRHETSQRALEHLATLGLDRDAPVPAGDAEPTAENMPRYEARDPQLPLLCLVAEAHPQDLARRQRLRELASVWVTWTTA